MKKLFSLGQKELASGLNSGGYYNENGGLWYQAKGLNPFIKNDNYKNMMAGCSAPTDITGAVIVDNPWAYASRITGSNAGTLYIYGDSGHNYSIDLSGTNNPVDLSHTVANSANGYAIFSVAGTDKLYYFQKTQIGTFDFASTWTDAWKTGLQSTTHHPTHPFIDRIYFGNLYYVGQIHNNAGTADINATALNLPSDYTVTCISDDGQYLVIGATKSKDTSSSSNTLTAETRVFFWDTNSASWQKEYALQSASINAHLS